MVPETLPRPLESYSVDRTRKKVSDMDHPMIMQIERYGYPENLSEQTEHCGTDFFGDEILEGDEVIEDQEAGELVLKENLEKYLNEEYGFKFTIAE
jgi:Hypothetical protein Yqai